MITYFVLDNGNPTEVYHSANCVCLKMHGPYKSVKVSNLTGLRACGICGGH